MTGRRRDVPIAVSVGCPAGIGPQVAVRGALEARLPALLVADPSIVRRTARRLGVAIERVKIVEDLAAHAFTPDHVHVWSGSERLAKVSRPGAPTAEDGRAQLTWIDQALDLVVKGEARALCTGPVSKEVIAVSDAPRASSFRGHTEYLAKRLRAQEVIMAFASAPLTVSLVTTHIPLSRVSRAVTPARVASSIYWLVRLLERVADSGRRLSNKRRGAALSVAIAALNPHAGEGGLLGKEELEVIEPGIRQAEARLRGDGLFPKLTGPIGAETAMRLAAAGQYNGVVAMYHDQATIPMKLLGFGDAVNVTLGLPIVRTSVDHGTGYDIARRIDADPSGMVEALRLAQRLTQKSGRGAARLDTDPWEGAAKRR